MSAGVKRNTDLSEATLTLRPLGELIDRVERTNLAGTYSYDAVRGVSNTKEIQKTKANIDGRNLIPFHVIKKGEFVFNRRTTRNGERLGLGFNDTDETYLFTEDYVAFCSKNENVALPGYLYLFFLRPEFDRYVRWDSWGSATEFFNWENMVQVPIPVPPLAVQQKVVDVWRGLRKMKEENEALAEPLMQLCRSYLQDCKKKWPMKEIGPMIRRIDERNENNKIKIVKSVSVTKEFKDTNAKVDKSNLVGYKIVRPGEASFVQTTGNEKCLCFAVSHFEESIVVTSVNEVLSSNDELLLDFLYLWILRPEFDRYARYNSWGSAREIFDWSDMCRVKIPLPPIEVQQAVVDVYRCASEAKKIAEEADRLSREICPSLVRWAAEGGTA